VVRGARGGGGGGGNRPATEPAPRFVVVVQGTKSERDTENRRLGPQTAARSEPGAGVFESIVACRLSTAGTWSAPGRARRIREGCWPRAEQKGRGPVRSLATDAVWQATEGAQGASERAPCREEAPRPLVGQYYPARAGQGLAKRGLEGGLCAEELRSHPAVSRAQGQSQAAGGG